MGSRSYLQINGKRGFFNMIDIVERLRLWNHCSAVPACALMDDAAAEIESLRLAIRRLAEQDATLSVCDGAVTVIMDAVD